MIAQYHFSDAGLDTCFRDGYFSLSTYTLRCLPCLAPPLVLIFLARVTILLGARLYDGRWPVLVADRSTRGTATLDALDHRHALLVTWHDLAEDDVTAVEPGSDDGGDEELASVGVWAGVGHGEEIRLVVLAVEVLVGELFTVDRLATSAVTTREVAALKHELWDDAMEFAARIAEALLAGAQGAEVLNGFRDDIVKELEVDAAGTWCIGLVHVDYLAALIAGGLRARPGDVEVRLDDHVGSAGVE
jgi:hypothetical protein